MAKRKADQAMTVDDEQNFVIDNKFYDAAIIPKTKREMWRRVSLRNNSKVGGAVFCGNLEIHNGPCTINQSVLAKEEITIKLGKGSGRSEIGGCVQAGRNIVVESEEEQDKAYLVIIGDLHSNNINLTNCVVYGSVYSETALLRNSIVLGSVYSRKRLELSNSVIGQYLARSVKIGENTRFLHPVSASENKPDIEEHPGFLLIPDDEEGEPTVIPFSTEDIASNVMMSDDPDAILPNHIIGLGMRMLNADEVGAAVQKSVHKIAKILINTTFREQGSNEQNVWEEQILSVTNNEVKEGLDATFSLADVDLPDGNLDEMVRLLEYTTPRKIYDVPVDFSSPYHTETETVESIESIESEAFSQQDLIEVRLKILWLLKNYHSE